LQNFGQTLAQRVRARATFELRLTNATCVVDIGMAATFATCRRMRPQTHCCYQPCLCLLPPARLPWPTTGTQSRSARFHSIVHMSLCTASTQQHAVTCKGDEQTRAQRRAFVIYSMRAWRERCNHKLLFKNFFLAKGIHLCRGGESLCRREGMASCARQARCCGSHLVGGAVFVEKKGRKAAGGLLSDGVGGGGGIKNWPTNFPGGPWEGTGLF
jgi:hypothetical protein